MRKLTLRQWLWVLWRFPWDVINVTWEVLWHKEHNEFDSMFRSADRLMTRRERIEIYFSRDAFQRRKERILRFFGYHDFAEQSRLERGVKMQFEAKERMQDRWEDRHEQWLARDVKKLENIRKVIESKKQSR